ncbi:MAG TPA: hypothetical protein VMF08_18435 [Candidatus Sulfotelmatobacter sp.]|nr:hypothetical protein [Candidatus Sulfotelmatobacter sp.]
MSEYLGKHVSSMLRKEPFRNWPIERSVDDDLEEREINYVFKENGLALCCDQNDQISAIFLYSEHYKGFDETLSDVPLSWGRAQVLDHFGSPSKSGGKLNDPILGALGPWDRFIRLGFTIHIEYRPDSDRIKMVTLMRSDVVPSPA